MRLRQASSMLIMLYINAVNGFIVKDGGKAKINKKNTHQGASLLAEQHRAIYELIVMYI